ncbi:PIG-L deacetylase family protein [Pararoseomonas indoligenes]|uniref:PIG-L family deacetylase n=1 Tax=Roseomonas indoligenes TaxID=2820811 RepID=A0A940MVJ8_9PROT|nr:PIG-L family deacetylase [Pararoseomonas indoligenes]MBP0491760.1 PIG-L family deacetylase [Pararoseomonas indoligenes]
MPLALALSPHLDDAAFSAGGVLARMAGAGWEVLVATLFTATVPNPAGFALACQTDKGLPPEADYMAIRRAEDLAACAALGARAIHLPLREAPHRGYHSAAALFAGPRSDDMAHLQAHDVLTPLLRDLEPALILAPQAIGGHVDHVLTVRAIQLLDPRVPILWWRDFPYITRADTPRRPFEAMMARFPEIDLPTDPAKKHAACAAYATQLGYQFGGPEGLARALVETEGHERARVQGETPVLARAA